MEKNTKTSNQKQCNGCIQILTPIKNDFPTRKYCLDCYLKFKNRQPGNNNNSKNFSSNKSKNTTSFKKKKIDEDLFSDD